MTTKISDMIINEQATVAAKLLDYYDGKQEKHPW